MTILITILTLLTIGAIIAVPRAFNSGSTYGAIFLLQVLAVEGAIIVGLMTYTFTY